MKKILTTVIVLCLILAGCLTVFAACDGGGDYEHTIVFYSSQGQDLAAVTDTAITNFQTKYPGWKVEHIQPGGYDAVLSKVRSDLTAGLQPDLAYCYADHVAQYIDSETVVDMNAYLTNSESYTYTYKDDQGAEQTKTIDRIGFTQADVDSFIPGYLEEGRASNFTGYQGDANALITLPFVKSTELLFYNPDALKELGYTAPPATWDELWEICGKAKQTWKTCTPLGYDSEANWFITMAEQMGFGYTSADPAQHFLFNNDAAKAWLTQLREYYTKQYITTQEIYGSYTSALFAKGPANAGLVFCIGSSGGASNQAGTGFTTEVAPIPGVDAEHNQCISQGPSLVMLSGGNGVTNTEEKQIMTFQFIKELLDVKFQAKFAKASGYNPMRSDVYEDADYAMFLDGKDPETGDKLTGKQLVVSKAAKAATQLTDRFFTSPAFIGSSVARNQMTSVVQYVLLGQKDAARALSDAYKACGGK